MAFSRSWDDANYSNQSLYGANGPYEYILDKQIVLEAGSGGETRSRLDFAGQWADFTAEVDVEIDISGGNGTGVVYGMVYRTTGWSNADANYAYAVELATTSVTLLKGSNSSSGSAGTRTQIATTALSLSTGNVHRLKVVAVGSSHKIYVDNVLYLNATDSTYTGAGYIGLRISNGAGKFTLNKALAAGTAYHSLDLNNVNVPLADGTQLTVDSTGTHPETVYLDGAVGATTSTTSTVQITTSSSGSGAAQADWTPAFAHAVGVRVTAPVTVTALFDNFGVASTLSGTWVSPALDLTSANILQDSFIGWTQNTPGTSTVLVEASIDGGASYHACTNGTALPVLSQGQFLSKVKLQLRVTLTTQQASTLPVVSGLSVWVIGQLYASGSRISVPLNLAPVGRVGNSLIAWDATLPSDGTLLGVDVSPDGLTWTDVSSQNGEPIPFLTSQQDPPYRDDFSVDLTATNYFQTWLTSGASWQVQTGNSQLVGTGGVNALLVYTPQTMQDGEITVDSSQCDNGGIVFGLAGDISACYLLTIADGSSTQNPNNRMRLYKWQNGALTQLGLSASLNFNRGTPRRFRVVMSEGTITVSVDTYQVAGDGGTIIGGPDQVLTYTDPSPLPAGYVGLRSSGGTNIYSQLRIKAYGQDVSSGAAVYTRLRLSTTDPLYTPQVQSLTTAVYGDTIASGALIPATTYSTLSGSTNTIAQDFDDLARQSSNANGNFTWRILDNTLYFQDPEGNPAPFVITNLDMLVAAKVKVTRQSDLYRNESIIIGGIDVESRSEIQIANGFALGFNTNENIDSIDSIVVNGQAVSFGVQGVDSGKSWYFQQGQKGITADSSANPYANGTQVVINYQAQVQVIAKARNEGQIALLKSIDKTSGVVTVTESAPGLNSAAAQALANSRINQYAILTVILTFTTLRPGFKMGQLLTVFLPQHDLINMTFLITQVDYSQDFTVRNGQNDTLEYFAVQATSGPIVGDWTHLFE